MDTNALMKQAVQMENDGGPPRHVPGVVNIVVFDKTQTPPPPDTTTVPHMIGFEVKKLASLTFWWHTGGLFDAFQGYADGVCGAASWSEALQAALAVAKEKSAKIGSLQFWGHGADAQPLMAHDSLTTADFKPGGKHYELLLTLRDAMDPEHGSVWFRSCNVFRKSAGQAFAKAAADLLGVPVVGHTFITHVLQSGTEVARPGEAPDWPDDLGVAKNRHKDGTDLLWSDPFRKRTATIFRFFPPLHKGDLVPGKSLLDILIRLFT